MEPDGPPLLWALSKASARIMSAMSLLETSLVMARAKNDPSIWRPLDLFVSEAKIEVCALDAEQASLARAAFLKYGKGRHPAGLNFGDCAAYALAKSRNVPLLCKGADFAKTDIVTVGGNRPSGFIRHEHEGRADGF
jgi:ribonuclease VapC